MAQSVEMTASVAASRVRSLKALLDDLDTVHPALGAVQYRQTTALWTDIPSCAAFTGRYREAIDASRTNLRMVWTQIEALARGPQLSAAAITNTLYSTTASDSYLQPTEGAGAPPTEGAPGADAASDNAGV